MGHDVPRKNGSAIGIDGIESVRLGGMMLDQLPIREAAITKMQWADKVEDENRQKVENIKAEYPTQKISYLSSRVIECEANIQRIIKFKSDQQAMIDQYTTQIGLCTHRDKEILKSDARREDGEITADEHKAAVKALRLEFPPYNVDAMKQQIVQCKEAIERADVVIAQEYLSIAELKEVITFCKMRDKLLKPYGAEIG
jgi:hypothetical protein